MSTKRLQRTVIEGGRYNRNKWDRRNSNQEARSYEREYCQQAMKDPDSIDEFDIEPRQKVYKEFRDKLNPMYRWLDDHVGQPWAKVHSKIFEIFDTRTTAGRHITFDHLLRSVVDTQSGYDSYGHIVTSSMEDLEDTQYPYRFISYQYYVDDDGMLQTAGDNYKKWLAIRYQVIPDEKLKEIGEWLNGRIISEKGGILYWHAPTQGEWKAAWTDPNKNHKSYYGKILKYFYYDNGMHEVQIASKLFTDMKFTYHVHGDFWQEVEIPFSFRQRGELSKEEKEYFKSLPQRSQKEILSYSKGR